MSDFTIESLLSNRKNEEGKPRNSRQTCGEIQDKVLRCTTVEDNGEMVHHTSEQKHAEMVEFIHDEGNGNIIQCTSDERPQNDVLNVFNIPTCCEENGKYW